jgi:uncharacterized phage-like protein YoqJ
MDTMMTGSREVVANYVGPVIQDGIGDELFEVEPDTFYFGGARGSDTLALVAAGNLKNEFDVTTELVVVVPWTLEDQPSAVRPAVTEHADRVVELEHEAPVGTGRGYHARNEWMIDQADRCRVFWNGESSGTKATAEKADEAGLTIRVHEIGDLGEATARSVMGQ